jgi:rhombotail lipoprotein
MRSRLVYAVALLLVLCGCVEQHRTIKSNALEYLYPKGTGDYPPADVLLTVPVRVGIAFAPPKGGWQDVFTEDQKQALLDKIVAAFEHRETIQSVQAIPSIYLTSGGGFADLDRVTSAFGIDLMALVSYDQVQFSDTGKSSLAYWTLIGAYFVEGEKSETRTMLDAAVFDIRSRAMLFNASGRSASRGRATPLEVERELRSRSGQGFESATVDLIANLETALDAFQEQAKTGTVRGPGTPAIAVVDEAGQPVAAGGSGGGAVGLGELVAATLLVLSGLCRWRRKSA